jgi:protease YdgD
MRHALLTGLWLLLLAGLGAATAQPRLPPSALPGLGAADPRRPVDFRAEPWRALGRVQLEVGGRCTGVLVGPRLVLTAAHCLVARRAGRLVQPGSVHFLLGHDRGSHVAHARVTAYRTGPGFLAAGEPAAGASVASDWALLTLDQPIGTPGHVLPLLRQAPAAGAALMLGGYQRDRPEVLLADTGCRVLGLGAGTDGRALLLHDCAGTSGVSGAPLLARGPDGGWAVAGVAARAAPQAARGLAVPAEAIGLPP